MGSDPAEMAAAALKMIEQGARSAKEYRKLAYAKAPGGAAVSTSPECKLGNHLRLPGGEQLGPIDPAEGLPQSPSRERGDEVVAGPLARARSSIDQIPSFAAIDVNLACPVKKISRKARGGHWLAEPAGAIAILEAVREAVPAETACTLKIRRSFDDTPEMAGNFWKIIDATYAMGYAWVTVHARTVEQKYVGPSRWDLLRDIVTRARKTDPDRPMFGSGDIWQAADIFRMIDYTGVTGVSVARGCIGNPWIFKQARDLLTGRRPVPPTIAEQRGVLEEHFDLALAVNAGMRRAESFTGRTMRKFGIRFAEHHPQTDEVRRRFIKVTTHDEWRGVLDEYYVEDARSD
jgi:tRNA-dihydrouridine synthase B